MQAYIELAADYHETVPEPTQLDRIVLDPDVVEAARLLIRVEPASRSVRVNITLPEDLLAAVDRFAARAGFTRSGLLAQAVRERLRREREAAQAAIERVTEGAIVSRDTTRASDH